MSKLPVGSHLHRNRAASLIAGAMAHAQQTLLEQIAGVHTGLEGLARDIGPGHPNDDLHPAVAGHVEPQTRLLNRVRFSVMQKIMRPAH
jgi:hypothetical protein